MTKRLLIIFLLALPVFGETYTYYVNPGAEAGGDGTTTATSGANAAFDHLNDFASIHGDASTHTYICEVVAAGEDTTVVTFDGWTDATELGHIVVNVAAAYRHDGTRGSGFRLSVDDAGGAISIAEPYVLINGVAVTNSNGGGEGFYVTGDDVVVANCLVYDCDGTAGIYGLAAAANMVVINCFVYGCDTGIRTFAEIGIIAQCTVLNSDTYGIVRTDYNRQNGYSNYAAGSGTADYFETGSNDSWFLYYCVSGDGTADDYGEGNNNTANKTLSTDLVTAIGAGSENGNLVSGSWLIGNGYDWDDQAWWTADTDFLGTDGQDYEGDTRTATWDVGADEYVVSGPSIPIIQYYRRQH